MSDKQLFEELEPNGDKQISTPKASKEKKKRQYTDEQKEAMRKRLEAGRKTALENRRKKALARKIDKQKETDEIDKKIKSSLDEKETTENLKEQLDKAKAELADMKKEKKEVVMEIKEVAKQERKEGSKGDTPLVEKKNELKELQDKMTLMARVIDTLLSEKKKAKKEEGKEELKERMETKVDNPADQPITKPPQKPNKEGSKGDTPLKPVIFDAMTYNKRGRFL